MLSLREMTDRIVEGSVFDERNIVDGQGRKFLLKTRLREHLPKKGTRVGFIPNMRPFRGKNYALDFVSAEVLDRVLSIRS